MQEEWLTLAEAPQPSARRVDRRHHDVREGAGGQERRCEKLRPRGMEAQQET